MLAFSKFNDENYDGIMLKLSSWFIKMNKLEPIIKQLEEELKKCEYSIHHPDHVNNLYELKNFESKQEIIKEKKDKELLVKNKLEEYNQKLESGEIYELEYSKYFDSIQFDESLWITDPNDPKNIICLATEEEWLTNKINIKKQFVENIKSKINTPELLDDFLRLNFPMISELKRTNNILNINLDNLYINNKMRLSISYTVLCVKKRTNKKYYTLVKLGLKDNVYFLNDCYNFDKCEKLNDYCLQGMTLIKNN